MVTHSSSSQLPQCCLYCCTPLHPTIPLLLTRCCALLLLLLLLPLLL